MGSIRSTILLVVGLPLLLLCLRNLSTSRLLSSYDLKALATQAADAFSPQFPADTTTSTSKVTSITSYDSNNAKPVVVRNETSPQPITSSSSSTKKETTTAAPKTPEKSSEKAAAAAAPKKPSPQAKKKDDWASLIKQHNGFNSNYTVLFDRIYKKHPNVFKFGEEGRDMMDTLLRNLAADNKHVTILEIGVWLGQSTARWLQLAENVRVVGVDPFAAPRSNHAKLAALSESDRSGFGNPDFNKALASYVIDQKTPGARNRTLLLTGYYPGAAKSILQDKLIDVNVFYIDGGKVNSKEAHVNFINATITGMLESFPNAILSGDDWKYVSYKDPVPFQNTVIELAKKSKRQLYVAKERTWIMAKDDLPPHVAKLGKRIV